MQAAAKANPKPFFAVYTAAEASSPRGHEAARPVTSRPLAYAGVGPAAVPVPADEKYISIRRVQTVVTSRPLKQSRRRRQPRRPPGPTKEPRACAGLGRRLLHKLGPRSTVLVFNWLSNPAQMLQVDPKTLEPALRANALEAAAIIYPRA
eukprot:tig00020892_g14937.t1